MLKLFNLLLLKLLNLLLLKLLNLLLKLLIVVGYYVLSFIEAVESVAENVDCCRLHYVL